YHGKIFWRAAFIDIGSCAELLARALSTLTAQPYVRDFTRLPYGTLFPSNEAEAVAIELPAFDCRDMRGRCVAHHVKLFMQKVRGRPHDLHLITFYPYIPMP
ncbi:MAG: hypothetical protein AAFX00_01870, partial [Pseudomonadota bacterium]